MPASWKTIRVFISSTFKDMHAERDHLVRFVFPKLREELLKWRVHLEDVDLRWGVTTDQDAFDLCMTEIKNCHPRFLCMLGGRYGWVPPPREVASDFLRSVLAGASAARELAPVEEEALRALYVPSDEAGNHRLKAKPWTQGELEVYRAQSEVAVRTLQRAGLEEATRSITASEIRYGALDRLQLPAFRYFYFRKDSVTDSIPEPFAKDYREAADSPAEGYLAEIKTRIKDPATLGRVLTAPGHEEDRPLTCHEYPCQWDAATSRIVDLKDFGEMVYGDLLASVKAQFGDVPEQKEAQTDEEKFAEEAEQMEAFIEERTQRYILGSREPLMREMLAFATTEGTPNLFVLTGAPGSGKSAILAQFTRELSAIPHPSWVIPHFVGASTGSTDLRRTLGRLCHELANTAQNSEPLPLDIKDLITHFQKLLTEASAKQRVVLVFDALNQFDATDGAHWMNWLPRELPPGVRIVASVIAPAEGEKEHQTLAILRNRKDARVEELKPLNESDTQAIIEGYLKRYSKRLSEEQIAALKEKPASHLPLYVLTALKELRTLGTYEEITDRIHTLPDDARALFGWILKRLSVDPLFGRVEEATRLVEKFASCLGVSRHGLSPAELTALLDPGDPLGNVAALLRLLRPYLMRRGELLDFYHGQFREAAEKVYLQNGVQRYTAHEQIASYFRRHADPEQDQQWKGENSRPFVELAFHLARSDADELPKILFNFNWLQAKTDKALVQELIQDYDEALWALDTKHHMHRALEVLQSAIRLSAHVISGDKNQLAGQLVGRMITSEVQDLLQLVAVARSWSNSPTLFPTTPSLANPASGLVATDFGAGSGISSVGFSESGKLAVIAYRSGAMRITEIDTGRELESVQWATQAPTDIAVSEHGGHVLWTTRDGDLWLWGADRSAAPICLDDPNKESKGMVIRSINVADQTSALAMDRDGLFAITGTFCGTLLRWELTTGNKAWSATTVARAVRDIAISPCGAAALCSWNDETWRIIDTATGGFIQEFRGHSKPVLCVALSVDAKLAVSGAADCYVRVWDSVSGTTVRLLEGHSKEVTALALSPNGQFVASASADRTIRIVDLKTSSTQVISRSHDGTVDSIAFSRDRRTLYCAAGDNLRSWKVTL